MTRDQLLIFKMADDVEGGIHRERVLVLHSPRHSKSDKIIVQSNTELNNTKIGLTNEVESTRGNKNIIYELDDNVTANLKDAKNPRLPKRYKKRDFLFAGFSTVLFLADFVSDIILALQYYKESEVLLFQLTVCFIVAPSLFSFIINCVWNYMVYVEQSEKKDLDFKLSKKLLFLRIFFSLIQLGRLFRYV